MPDIVTGTGRAESLEMPPEGVVVEVAILLAYLADVLVGSQMACRCRLSCCSCLCLCCIASPLSGFGLDSDVSEERERRRPQAGCALTDAI